LHGSDDYFSHNGRKGGAVVYAKYGTVFYSRNGKKGAEAKSVLKKGTKRKKWKAGEKKHNNSNKGSVGSSAFKSVVGSLLVYDNKRQ
jgi:hypothetical protein